MSEGRGPVPDVGRSALLGKLSSFLPQLKSANADLDQKIATLGQEAVTVEIGQVEVTEDSAAASNKPSALEEVREQEAEEVKGQYIKMDLTLGVVQPQPSEADRIQQQTDAMLGLSSPVANALAMDVQSVNGGAMNVDGGESKPKPLIEEV
jgi:ABC-type Na+ efflux pump permease subunit